MSTSMVQMNTRIDQSLKQLGDEALLRAGYTPSQAVRKLWQFAVENAQNPRAIRDALENSANDSSGHNSDYERKELLLQQAKSLIPEAYKKLHIQPSEFTKNARYEELRDFALLDRFEDDHE